MRGYGLNTRGIHGRHVMPEPDSGFPAHGPREAPAPAVAEAPSQAACVQAETGAGCMGLAREFPKKNGTLPPSGHRARWKCDERMAAVRVNKGKPWGSR